MYKFLKHIGSSTPAHKDVLCYFDEFKFFSKRNVKYNSNELTEPPLDRFITLLPPSDLGVSLAISKKAINAIIFGLSAVTPYQDHIIMQALTRELSGLSLFSLPI